MAPVAYHRRMGLRRSRLLAALGIALMVPGAIAAGQHPSAIGYLAATLAIGIAVVALALALWPALRRDDGEAERPPSPYHDD